MGAKIYFIMTGLLKNQMMSLMKLEYYQKIHAQQAGLPYEKKIVGGGIPFYDGTVEIVNKL